MDHWPEIGLLLLTCITMIGTSVVVITRTSASQEFISSAFEELRRDFKELKQEFSDLKDDFSDLKDKMGREIADIRVEVAGIISFRTGRPE